MIGVDPDSPRSDHVALVPRGATALLFTDGLTERRGEDLTEGLGRLAAAAAAHHHLPLEKFVDTLLEVVERDREVPWVPTGRVEPEAGGAQDTDPDQGERLEPYEGHVLSELVDRGIPCREHRDPVLAVGVVVPLGISSQHQRVQQRPG